MVEGGDQEPQSQSEPQPQQEPLGPRLIGYAVGGFAVLLVVVAMAALITGWESGDGDDGGSSGAGEASASAVPDLLPDGGAFATPREGMSLEQAAKAAGCELESFEVENRDHVASLDEKIRYSSSPPTSGRHHPVPAEDGAYSVSPEVEHLVHTLEHSRVIVWFERDLPRDARSSLKAFYDHDAAFLVLVPDTTGMTYEVAATAWNRDPRPNGTGRLLGCPDYNDAVFTALEAFKDKHRGRGPEQIP